jgi:hypothetical protein
MLDWIGGTNYTYTMNELYSAMQNLQDEPDTVDDGTAFFADTPVEYTIGKIDAGDNDPFYITFALMQRITGGSLRTNGWAHVNGTNTGIVIVKGTQGSPVMDSGDIGLTVTGSVDGSGTLLEVISDGTDEYLVIRPDDATTGNEFNGTAGAQVITSTGGGDFDQTVAQTTGDMIWANLYSIGTIDPNVHLYLYQGDRLTTDDSNRVYDINDDTKDFWGNGHFDICVPIKEYDSATWAVIDAGYARVFARKGGDLFSSFEVSTSITSGGRNPIPLQTSLDLDAGYSSELGRGHGTQVISFSGAVAAGPFVNGEIITGGTSGGRGILDLTNSTVTSGGELVYWPIAEDDAAGNFGGSLTALQSGEVVTGESGANVTTDGAPANDGPASAAWFTSATAPTITFANAQVDIDNDGNDENWGITVDCNANPLTEVYQWLKYICGYGQGAGGVIITAEPGVEGEEYEGATAYFGYSAISGTIAEGESVTQQNTLATGVIISHDTATPQVVLLRSTRGVFNNSDTIDADDDADNFTPDEAGNFAFTAAAPLGTFAGGTFFGARGVVLTDYLAADENSFILTDIEGNSRQRPTSITITVTNLSGNAETEIDADLVTIYYLTGSGGDIDKDTMLCDGGETVGSTTLDVDDIPTWVPAAGRLVLVDVDAANQEYVIGYTSWNGTTDQFTLDSLTPANLTAGTDEDTLVSTTDELDGLTRGDIVVNDTRGAVQYVTDVQAGTNTVNCYPPITGQVAADTIYINTTPDITVSASDLVFVPIMHRYATGASEQVALIYPGSTVYFRTKVRNTREVDLVNGPIKPYSSDGETSGTDQSIPVVRTIDTIIS